VQSERSERREELDGRPRTRDTAPGWPASGRRRFWLTACLLALGCGEPTDSPQNLLLITIDTLRVDHLGAWGYERRTSPGIDALAAQSVVFEEARSQSSWTLPSLASLMTSFYTSTHGCWDFDSRLSDSFTTLAEILTDNDYATAGVASHIFLAERYALNQGFQEYDQDLVLEGFASHAQITSPRITDKGIAWLAGRRHDPAPWFLWLHYFDPHAAYKRHPDISEAFGVERPVDLYDGEIAFTDRAVARLLARLAELDLAKQTIVVLTADHGEEFYDHRGKLHGKTLYHEVIRVPLMIRAPGYAPRRVRGAVRSVDLLPTLLELMGLPPPVEAEGLSLVSAMRGAPLDARPVLTEVQSTQYGKSESLAVGRWKLIRRDPEPSMLLFDLEADPEEKRNVAAEHPELVAELIEQMESTTKRARALSTHYGGPLRLQLSPNETKSLRQLGYLEGEP